MWQRTVWAVLLVNSVCCVSPAAVHATWRGWLHGVSVGKTFTIPLGNSAEQGEGSQGERSRNFTLATSVKFNLHSYWFFNVTYYTYLNQKTKAPWNPDFSYVFGYDDWHPYTFSLLYSNYGGNRLNPNKKRGEKFTRIEEGAISLGWKFPVPPEIEKLFIVHETGGLTGGVNYNLTPRYMNLASLKKEPWKQMLSLSIKYAIYKWWYANITIFYYPIGAQKQPWDPDFTYGFGYFDWHPGTLSIQYNNYSGNRLPWKKNVRGTGRLRDGSLSVAWGLAW